MGMPAVLRGQKRVLSVLEVGLRMVVSHSMVAKDGTGFSRRAASALKSLEPSLQLYFLAFNMGATDSNSGTHTFGTSTYPLSHLPHLFLFLFYFIAF